MERTTSKLTVKDLAQISMMTALTAVCAWLTIPFTVPFTMQTFAVFTTLLLLYSIPIPLLVSLPGVTPLSTLFFLLMEVVQSPMVISL